MPSPDALIVRDGPVVAPLDYQVPAASEMIPLCVTATFDGSLSALAYEPTLEIIAPDGHVIARCPLRTQIAAGGSADVTWFPGLAECCDTAVTPPAASFQTETLMLDTRDTSGVQSSQVLQAGVTYDLSVWGNYSAWNLALTLGTPDLVAIFPTSGGVARNSTTVGIDAETMYAWPPAHPKVAGHWTTFEMQLDGATWAHVEPIGGPFATPRTNHFYRYQVVGQGKAIAFKITDSVPLDNYGALQITINALPGGSSAQAVTDGTTVVAPASALEFTAGAIVTDAGDGTAQIAIAGGGSVSAVDSPGGTIGITNPAGPTVDLDLPATGVGAGSYGDATHVAALTVDAEGRLSAASQVAISGLAGSGLVQLFTTTLGATGALDTGANGIAAGHGSLIVHVLCRSAVAATTESITIRANGDSAAHYDDTYLFTGSAATPSSGQSHLATSWADAMLVTGNTSTANYAASMIIEIPMYDNTTWFKIGTVRTYMIGGTSTFRQALLMAAWESTAAINQLAIDSASHFLTGSIMTVYGIA